MHPNEKSGGHPLFLTNKAENVDFRYNIVYNKQIRKNAQSKRRGIG